MYEVWLESRAERELRKLPSEVFERILKKISALAEDPKPAGSRKIIGSENDWRLRAGEYRIIYEIDEETRSIFIIRIRHRREAYRK